MGPLHSSHDPKAWEPRPRPGSQRGAMTHPAGGWAHKWLCCSHTGRGHLFGWQPLSPEELQPPPFGETVNTTVKSADTKTRLPLQQVCFSSLCLSFLISQVEINNTLSCAKKRFLFVLFSDICLAPETYSRCSIIVE